MTTQLKTVPVTIIEDADAEAREVISQYRHFAEFFLVDSEGSPVEEYHILTEDCWLPESFFRKLIALLKRCGIFWHPQEILWGISEGLKASMEYKLYKGLQRLATNHDCPMWVMKVR